MKTCKKIILCLCPALLFIVVCLLPLLFLLCGCDGEAEDFFNRVALQDDDDGGDRIAQSIDGATAAIREQTGAIREQTAEIGQEGDDAGVGLASIAGAISGQEISDDPESNTNASSNNTSSTGVAGFVWKPISEGDGNLVILLPSWDASTSLSVNGEQARYVGRTNGDRSTHRLSAPGCNYGTRPTIETDTGFSAPVIENGCNRKG